MFMMHIFLEISENKNTEYRILVETLIMQCKCYKVLWKLHFHDWIQFDIQHKIVKQKKLDSKKDR